MIENQQALFDVYSVEDCRAMERSIYKGTDCGAWIQFLDNGITIGSIVEGSDNGTESYTLSYPFTTHDLDEIVNAVEAEADVIWKWANEEDEGFGTPMDQGLDFPDVAYDFRHLKGE